MEGQIEGEWVARSTTNAYDKHKIALKPPTKYTYIHEELKQCMYECLQASKAMIPGEVIISRS